MCGTPAGATQRPDTCSCLSQHATITASLCHHASQTGMFTTTAQPAEHRVVPGKRCWPHVERLQHCSISMHCVVMWHGPDRPAASAPTQCQHTIAGIADLSPAPSSPGKP